jgi:hypothetical protein
LGSDGNTLVLNTGVFELTKCLVVCGQCQSKIIDDQEHNTDMENSYRKSLIADGYCGVLLRPSYPPQIVKAVSGNMHITFGANRYFWQRTINLRLIQGVTWGFVKTRK